MDISTFVYLVQHIHSQEDADEEDVKVIGIYSTQEEAAKAVERLRSKPGFCEQPDNFSIDAYVLDMDNWTDGFITITSAQT